MRIKRLFFISPGGLGALVASHPRHQRLQTLPAKSRPKTDRFKPIQGKKIMKKNSCHFALL
jgi:hypothetical protein